MSGLSHGVVRVDQDNSLTSLTLQDCGQVVPAALGQYRLTSDQPSEFSDYPMEYAMDTATGVCLVYSTCIWYLY